MNKARLWKYVRMKLSCHFFLYKYFRTHWKCYSCGIFNTIAVFCKIISKYNTVCEFVAQTWAEHTLHPTPSVSLDSSLQPPATTHNLYFYTIWHFQQAPCYLLSIIDVDWKDSPLVGFIKFKIWQVVSALWERSNWIEWICLDNQLIF